LRIIDLEGEHCPTPYGEVPSRCTDELAELPPFPGRIRATERREHLIYALALSHDGRFLAIGTTDGQLLWTDLHQCNLATADGELGGLPRPNRYHRLDGSLGAVLDVAFMRQEDQNSSDRCMFGAPRLVSVGKDGSVRVWKPQDRVANPFALTGSGTELYAVALSPDDGLIAVGDSNAGVLVWDRRVQDYACDMVIRNLSSGEWDDHLYHDERAVLEDNGHFVEQICPVAPAEQLRATARQSTE
jgi:WD40 repeat protein